MDSDCEADRACMDVATSTTHAAAPMIAIPDNAPAGISSEIVVAEGGAISSLAVTVDITHSYDLVLITLGAIVLPGALAWIFWPMSAKNDAIADAQRP